MPYEMSVVSDFGDYRRGDRITDPAEMKALRDDPNVVRVAVERAPAEPKVAETKTADTKAVADTKPAKSGEG